MSATVKTINTGVLAISYLEYGPASGWPCIMGHGFPYDAHAYDQAAPILAQGGARDRSGADGVIPSTAHHAKKFTGPHEHRAFAGAGHNLPQERPEEWAQAVIDARKMANR